MVHHLRGGLTDLMARVVTGRRAARTARGSNKEDVELGVGIFEVEKEVKLGRLAPFVQRRLRLRLQRLERLRKKELPERFTLPVVPRTVVDERVLVAIE